jgi:hypothetical protein
LENNLIWVCLLAVISISLIIWLIYRTVLNAKKELNLLESTSFLLKIRKIYNVLIFPLVSFNLILLFISTVTNNKRTVWIDNVTFPVMLSNLILIFGLAASGMVLGLELTVMRKNKLKEIEVEGEYEIKHWYASLFLIKLVFECLLISLFMLSPSHWVLFTLSGLQLIYLTTLIFLQPYHNIFSTIAVILYSSASLFSTIFAILNNILSWMKILKYFSSSCSKAPSFSSLVSPSLEF